MWPEIIKCMPSPCLLLVRRPRSLQRLQQPQLVQQQQLPHRHLLQRCHLRRRRGLHQFRGLVLLQRRAHNVSMKKKRTAQSAFVNLRAAFVLLLCAAACCTVAGTPMAFFRSEAPTKLSQQTLTFADRVTYQRAIEEVYWRHRIWPKGRPDPKPWLDAVISQAQIEEKVQD